MNPAPRYPIVVYFNNTADGHAITNAKQLQEICDLVHHEFICWLVEEKKERPGLWQDVQTKPLKPTYFHPV